MKPYYLLKKKSHNFAKNNLYKRFKTKLPLKVFCLKHENIQKMFVENKTQLNSAYNVIVATWIHLEIEQFEYFEIVRLSSLHEHLLKRELFK